MEPPDRCVATILAMAGFSATHRILGAIARAPGDCDQMKSMILCP